MEYTPVLKKKYREEIISTLMKEFSYDTVMQAPKLEKIIINQGIGQAVADKKMIDSAIDELTLITGQKAVKTYSRKDISNFKLRKGMPIGVKVTLRRERMYEFLERLICDFSGLPLLKMKLHFFHIYESSCCRCAAYIVVL